MSQSSMGIGVVALTSKFPKPRTTFFSIHSFNYLSIIHTTFITLTTATTQGEIQCHDSGENRFPGEQIKFSNGG